MPHDIDYTGLKSSKVDNPYATEDSIKIKPKRHKKTEDKIEQTMIDIILIIDRNKLETYQDCLSCPDCLIRILTLHILRNDGKLVDDKGNKISSNKFLKLAKKYAKDKIDSEQRFWMEDILRNLADEMLAEYKAADAELKKQQGN